MEDNLVVKSNALIEAAYHPESRYQMRVLLACVSMIKSDEELKVGYRFELTANALADLTGDKAKNNYRELRKAADEIMDMTITLRKGPGGERLIHEATGKPDKRKINVAALCDYYDRQGKVVIEFTHAVLPYLSDLESYFTKYRLKYIMKMKSAYGVRLYELLVQWFGNEREFAIDEFKEIFGITDKYKAMCDLKKRVIYPAIDDINNHSNIKVSFGQRKKGRTVTHLQFKFKEKKTKPAKLTSQFIQTHAKPGMDWQEATEYAKKVQQSR